MTFGSSWRSTGASISGPRREFCGTSEFGLREEPSELKAHGAPDPDRLQPLISVSRYAPCASRSCGDSPKDSHIKVSSHVPPVLRTYHDVVHPKRLLNRLILFCPRNSKLNLRFITQIPLGADSGTHHLGHRRLLEYNCLRRLG